MEYEIKLAEKDNAAAIVKLLDKVTLSLHKNNINQWSYPWDFKEIENDIENRNTYIVTKNNLVTGTFSLKDAGDKPWLPAIKAKNLYLYRIAILPEYQEKNIGLQIINFSHQISSALKASLYLDCWAGNEKLKSYYLKAGFDLYGNFPEEDYIISVFKSID